MDLSAFDGQELDGLDFCAKAYALFERIRSSEGGISRLRMRPTSLEKRLLEEILPICVYVQANYRPGRYMTIRWKDGSQAYDAELIQHGAYISENFYPEHSYLEVTCTMHRNDYLQREILETQGGGFGLDGIKRLKSGEIESIPVGYGNHEFIDSYSKIVQKRIASKSEKPYPEGTALLVQCTLNMPYLPNEWDALMARIGADLPSSPFREIFLYDTVCHYKKSFYPQM